MDFEAVLAGAVAVSAVGMIILWLLRINLVEGIREAAETESAVVVVTRKRRVRQLDHLLSETGLAFFVAAVGYVTLGVMPA